MCGKTCRHGQIFRRKGERRQNIRFPLKVRKIPAAEHDERVRRAAEMVDLTALLDRRPAELSGGQRQRVALARAIVREPTVFLMDELLSNLDAKLRVSTRAQVKNLQHRLKTTTIYVTHDQIEAMTLADRVVVMSGGIIQQVGTPTQIYDNPANTFVASFIGSPAMNLVSGRIAGGVFEAENIRVAGLPTGHDGPVTLGFRAENVTLTPQAAEISAPVYALELLGDASMVALRVGEDLVNIKAAKDYRAEIGDSVHVTLPAGVCHLFDAETGARLTPDA